MAKLLPILLSPQAAGDLDLIYDPAFSEIRKRLEVLRRFPELGTAVGGAFAGWRATTVRMFRVIYRISPRGIEVAYIRHCKRRTPGPPRTG